MHLLTTFARKKGSKDKLKRKKSIDHSLKKSQIFRNYVNPVSNTVREIRGTVKTGLNLGQFIHNLKMDKVRNHISTRKLDIAASKLDMLRKKWGL